MTSFNDIIPSKNLTEEEYILFLGIAKPYEMELDIISKDTYYEICNQLGIPAPKPKFPKLRKIYS